MKIAPGALAKPLAVAFILVLLGLVNLPIATGHEEGPEGSFATGEFVTAPFEAAPRVAVDGRVASGEYSPYGTWTDEDTGLTGSFVHDNSSLFVALTNPRPGWIALGFSSDLDKGMGFVVVGESAGKLTAEERLASNLSGNLLFSTVGVSERSPIEAFNASREGGNLTAELRLSFRTNLWGLEPGVITPALIAFNDTDLAFPSGTAGSEIHYLRFYPLRVRDDPADVQRLFAMDISPVSALVAIAILGMGVTLILRGFLWPRGTRESSGR